MSLLSRIEGAHQKLLRPSGGCHNCPRRRVDFVPARLRQTKVLFLGDSPSQEDVRAGEGFSGQSGQMLRRMAEEVGIRDYSLTHTVHCRPPSGTVPGPKEVQCCLSQFVLDEIRGYPIVVLCGNTPLQALFPGANANRMRGNVAWHPDFPGQRFYSIYHPSYISRRKDLESEFRQQMERLGRIAAGEPPLPWRVLRDTSAGFWEALQSALASPLISLDIETNDMLESWRPDGRIRSLAFTADAKTVIYARESDAGWIAVLEAVRKFLSSPEKHVVGLNTGFDLVWLEDELGFRVQCAGKHDVAAVWYEAKQYKMPSLKELVAKELDGYRYLVHQPGQDLDPTIDMMYNAEDVVYPFQLFHKGMAMLRPSTRDLVFRVLGPAGYILRRMTRHGLYLREDYRQQKIVEYEDRRRAAVEAWKAADPEFIPSTHESGKGLHDYLFRIKRLPVNVRTDKGEPSTEGSAIRGWIREGATYLEHLLTLREIDKIQSTYLTAYDNHVWPDGRIRSSYTNTFTDSSRSSSRKPNVQNIPRKREIRDLFGVPAGSLLLESDLSQIEFRIMVCLAQDENGMGAYLEGIDAHTLTARTFSPNPTKEHRDQAKAVNFALLYGGDWYNVQRSAREDYGLMWTEAECRDFVRAFWRTYPRLPEFHKQVLLDLQGARGWSETATGHIFHYSDWDHPEQGRRDHAYRSALNARAQGPAANICFLIAIHADRLFQERKLPAKMVNTVHDSIMTEISDPKQLGHVVAAIEEARALAYEWARPWFPVPLVMEHEVGESWGSLEPVKF